MGQRSQKSDPPPVGIVVLNWNNYTDTAACLSSIDRATYSNLQTIVVDNASEDGSADRLEREFNWCTILRNDENLGFAGGCNTGIDYFRDRGVDHVLLLNNDTTVEPDFIEPLVETAEREERVAGVSGIIHHSEREGIWFAGGELDPQFIRWDSWETVRSGGPYKTGFVTGAMLFLPGDALDEFGTLDDRFWFGGEDQDWSYRVTEAGWRLYVNPESVIYHRVSSTSGTGPFGYYQQTRNRLRFSSYHHTLSERLVFLTWFFVTRTIRFVQWGGSGQIGRIWGTLLGVADHYFSIPERELQYFERNNRL